MIKYLKYKDKKNREKNNNNSFLISYLYSNRKINSKLKFKIMLKMQELKNKKSMYNKVNRCIITNKSRAIMRLTSLSKAEFKKQYVKKQITGFTKSSW